VRIETLKGFEDVVDPSCTNVLKIEEFCFCERSKMFNCVNPGTAKGVVGPNPQSKDLDRGVRIEVSDLDAFFEGSKGDFEWVKLNRSLRIETFKGFENVCGPRFTNVPKSRKFWFRKRAKMLNAADPGIAKEIVDLCR
jgi:hypothetical protein